MRRKGKKWGGGGPGGGEAERNGEEIRRDESDEGEKLGRHGQ